MTSLPSQTDARDTENASGPGKRLRTAREALGLSVEDVARHLRLDARHVEAIERNDFSPFAAPVFVRGHLRGYARLVKLSPNAVIRAYDGSAPRPLQGRAEGVPGEGFGWLIYPLLLGVLVIAVIGWQTHGTFNLGDGKPEANGARTAAQAPTAPPVAAAPAVTQAPAASLDAAPPVQPEPPAAEEMITAPESAPVVPVAPPIEEVQPAAEPEPPPAVAAAPSLTLRFSGECWVEITDAANQRVVHGLFKAGETKTAQGFKPPLNALLGNASAAAVEYNGQPFDHSRYNRNNVARFTLGAQ
ncbi:MAG: RodZ domain-containing protein [Pseudomonadota bacterium]